MNLASIDASAWRDWSEQFSVDLTRLRVTDAPAFLLDDPYNVSGLQRAEAAAHELFPPGTSWHADGCILPVADRWNRFVLYTFKLLIGYGVWIDAPRSAEGPRNEFGLLPCLSMPNGRYVMPMLGKVLDAAWAGCVLTDSLDVEQDAIDRWNFAGCPEPEAR